MVEVLGPRVPARDAVHHPRRSVFSPRHRACRNDESLTRAPCYEAAMPITLTYDVKNPTKGDPNAHAYLRTAFQRFNWRQIGRSVFVYDPDPNDEDWLNEVIPALMFFRAFVARNEMKVEAFTVHVHSLSARENPRIESKVKKLQPSQSSKAALESFLECCEAAAPRVVQRD
jgi:hypothetical protein